MHLQGKVIFITGASSGIGQAIAVEAAKLGADIIIAARRIERLDILKQKLVNEYNIDVLAIMLDVTDNRMVDKVVGELSGKWRKIDILVNNAGLALGLEPFQEANMDNWETMIDVNIKGLLYVTKAILPIMLSQDSGHIVNIGSTAGQQHYPGGNVYSATKHAVRAISNSLRIDLLGKPIKVTEIAPGAVGDTEFGVVRFNSAQKAKEFYADFTALEAEDIADAVIYSITRRPHVNVSEITVYSVDQASSNHRYKRS